MIINNQRYLINYLLLKKIRKKELYLKNILINKKLFIFFIFQIVNFGFFL